MIRICMVLALLLVFLGCAHGPDSASGVTAAPAVGGAVPALFVPPDGAVEPAAVAMVEASDRDREAAAGGVQRDTSDELSQDYVEEETPAEKVNIADPLEPFNRAMYHFNDKLYFWLLKPVARGYRAVVPEKARVSVSNFFSNLAFPIRFVNSLLQGNVGGAASELGRFVVNTLWGIGGLLDPASGDKIDLAKQDEDFGQTLGVYGIGHGFFINWPLFGPSSPRDTIGLAGDFFLSPLTYGTTGDVAVGMRGFDKVNATSLRIGDYESLKEASIDPYVAIRSAYVQYRLQQVRERGARSRQSGSGGAPPAGGPAVEGK